jgi:hypothetical protein
LLALTNRSSMLDTTGVLLSCLPYQPVLLGGQAVAHRLLDHSMFEHSMLEHSIAQAA